MKLEHKVTGVAACLEVFRSRPSDVIRAYVTEQKLNIFSNDLRKLAASKKAYHVVAEEELKKVTEGSQHSEGVCLLVKGLPELTPSALLESLQKKPADATQLILLLENIENPHNLGALARVAAHFGADAIVCLNSEDTPSLRTNSAFYRVAEGGAEASPICDLKPSELKNFHKATMHMGFQWVATSSHAKKSVFECAFQPKTLLLLGSESHGLSAELELMAQAHVIIAGTGKVESLNVATAAAVLMSEFRRQPKPSVGLKAKQLLKPRLPKD